MKQGNLEKWNDLKTCQNLLFFSELVNELLFYFSIPSNRVATLNSHYLCLDAVSAIKGIESNGVPEGTLKPIVAELYLALQKDPAFDKDHDNPLRYFIKYQNDRYRLSTNISELAYEELKKAVSTLHTRYFANDWYYQSIKDKICDIVINNDIEKQPDLFRLTKSLLTELINGGYSQEYVFNIMDGLFWNPPHSIDAPERIKDFFNTFTFQRKAYEVILIVDKTQMGKLINYIDGLSFTENLLPRTNTDLEVSFFESKKRTHSFLIINRNAVDPFKAAEFAKYMISVNLAFYRLCDHQYQYDINGAKCGVYGDDSFFVVRQKKSAVLHTKTPSGKQIVESLSASMKALESISSLRVTDDYYTMINAALYHAQSLDSSSLQNQLLDLWAIFESVLNISNKHTVDRIIQICMYLVPILKRKYIYSLFAELANDIKNYAESEYNNIIGDAKKETDIVQRVCEFVILAENEDKRNTFLSSCSEFPLLKERIEYYVQMLSTPLNVYHFVEKHAERVKWQIMRIYRNRNLIIHNGDHMPYLSLLVENLHSYVDDFLSYSIHCLSEGHTIESMCQNLFSLECDWIDEFSNKKAVMNHDMILKMLSL